jgi:hypothetical protein
LKRSFVEENGESVDVQIEGRIWLFLWSSQFWSDAVGVIVLIVEMQGGWQDNQRHILCHKSDQYHILFHASDRRHITCQKSDQRHITSKSESWTMHFPPADLSPQSTCIKRSHSTGMIQFFSHSIDSDSWYCGLTKSKKVTICSNSSCISSLPVNLIVALFNSDHHRPSLIYSHFDLLFFYRELLTNETWQIFGLLSWYSKT